MTTTAAATATPDTPTPPVDPLVDLDQYDRPERHLDFNQPFQVQDLSTATWAMRKLRAAKQHLDKVAAVADEETERIQSWAAHASEQALRDSDYFTGLLTDYALRERAADPRAKTVSTPYGTISTRSSNARVDVADLDTFLAWARKHLPTAVRTKTTETADLTELRRRTAGEIADGQDLVIDNQTGEQIPGLTIHPATVTATVTPDKAA